MTVAGQYAQNNPHKPMNAFFIHYYSSHALNGTPISSTALYLLILQSMQSTCIISYITLPHCLQVGNSNSIVLHVFIGSVIYWPSE